MIRREEMRDLYRAKMRVVPAAAGSAFEHTILIVADSFKQAEKAAQPTVGHYSFELIALECINSVYVT